MTDYFQYTKPWADFGRFPNFDDTDVEYLGSSKSYKMKEGSYVLKNPTKHTLDNIPKWSEHQVNTERIPTQNKGMKHLQGGWPKDADPSENADVIKYKKKLD